MGRKLSALEAALMSFPDGEADAGQDRIISTRSQILQQQIAQQLGISPDEFYKASARPRGVQSGGTASIDFDPALSRECLELLDAYMRITDPEQRRRYLQAVREAAYGSADVGPATEA